MKETYQKPGNQELRKFGLSFGLFFILVLGILIPWFSHDSSLGVMFADPGLWPRWPWLVGVTAMIWAVIHPASLHLLHRLWMRFAEIAGWVNTRIIMVLLFYGLIFPTGLIMRLFGRDPMQRKFDKNLDSYRIIREPQDKNHMKAPY